MKFSISTEVLANYINLIGRVVKSKSNLPVLNNIYIEATSENKLRLIATDLEVQMITELEANVSKPGKTTVNASLFTQYLNSLKKQDSITIELVKNTLKVATNGSNAEFSTRDTEDFPLFDDTKYNILFTLPTEEFNLLVDKTLFSCAKDDIRPILTGLNIEIEDKTLTFVSLDTFRLSKISTTLSKPFPDKKQVVVPSDAISNINRVTRDSFISSYTDKDEVEFFVSKDSNFALFKYANISVYTRLLEGDYPNYKEIIPNESNIVVGINKQSFLEALKRVGVFAQNAFSQRVVLTFKDNSVWLEATVPEMGSVKEEVLLSEKVKEEFKIAFQLKFLSEIVNLINDDSFIFKGINSVSPVLFQEPTLEDKFLHILMPLKLEEKM